MPPEKVNLPDNWDDIVKDFSVKVQDALDANGQKAVCWVLTDQPVNTSWRLIKAKYNCCWQSIQDRGKFIPAFTDDGVLRNGMKEMPALRPVSAVLERDSDYDKIVLKVKRSGV